MNLTPLHDWVLVKMYPLKDETRGGVIVLADSSAQTVRLGTVLKVGPGRYATGKGKRVPPGVAVGERVGFLRWHLEHKSGKQISSVLEDFGDDVGLIRIADILFAYGANEEIKVS